MKLSAKVFLSAMFVLSVALSLSGYLLIASSYRNAVDQETQRAMDHFQYAKFLLQADLIGNPSDPISAGFSRLAEQSLPGLSDGGDYISVFGDDQALEYSTFPVDPGLRIADYDVERKIISKTHQIEGRTYVMVLGQITQSGRTLYLVTATDIQAAVDQKEKMVRNYGVIYFVAIGLGTVLVMVFSALLTGPIRKMSSAATRIADGNYSERLQVASSDEMGELSERFNAMAQTIEERIAELSKAAKQKEDFVSSFAHELKTPLTSVIGYADMIYQKPLPRDEVKNAAAFIMDEGLRLEALSLKLMDLTILNRQDFVLEELPADELLQNIADTLRPLLLGEDIRITVEAAKAYIRVDYDLFKTLLLNLVDNAAKAESTQINLIGRTTAKSYSVSVSDNGHGIPAADLDRITEAFYVVDKSRSRKQHGAGLGLAIAARIAEIHGSRLEFASAPGRGTTVSLSLAVEGGGGSE